MARMSEAQARELAEAVRRDIRDGSEVDGEVCEIMGGNALSEETEATQERLADRLAEIVRAWREV